MQRSTTMRKNFVRLIRQAQERAMWSIYIAHLSEQDQASKLPPPRSILLAPTFTPLHPQHKYCVRASLSSSLLHIPKSSWDSDRTSTCTWYPSGHHSMCPLTSWKNYSMSLAQNRPQTMNNQISQVSWLSCLAKINFWYVPKHCTLASVKALTASTIFIAKTASSWPRVKRNF